MGVFSERHFLRRPDILATLILIDGFKRSTLVNRDSWSGFGDCIAQLPVAVVLLLLWVLVIKGACKPYSIATQVA